MKFSPSTNSAISTAITTWLLLLLIQIPNFASARPQNSIIPTLPYNDTSPTSSKGLVILSPNNPKATTIPPIPPPKITWPIPGYSGTSLAILHVETLLPADDAEGNLQDSQFLIRKHILPKVPRFSPIRHGRWDNTYGDVDLILIEDLPRSRPAEYPRFTYGRMDEVVDGLRKYFAEFCKDGEFWSLGFQVLVDYREFSQVRVATGSFGSANGRSMLRAGGGGANGMVVNGTMDLSPDADS